MALLPGANSSRYVAVKPKQPVKIPDNWARATPTPYVPKPVVKKTAPKPAVKSTPAPTSARVTSSYPVVQSPQPVAPVSPIATPAPPSFADYSAKYLNSATSDVNALFDQQKASRLADLKAQRDAAIAKINQQKTATSNAYYGSKNQADVVSMQNIQRLREIMGANGLSASGENITANAQANSDRQGALNTLNVQEQGAMTGYNDQINDWNNPARDQAIISEIEAGRSQALLDSRNNAQEKAWREYTFNNMSASEKMQFQQNSNQFGEEMAWRQYEMEYNGNLQSGMNQTELDFYRNMGLGDFLP